MTEVWVVIIGGTQMTVYGEMQKYSIYWSWYDKHRHCRSRISFGRVVKTWLFVRGSRVNSETITPWSLARVECTVGTPPPRVWEIGGLLLSQRVYSRLQYPLLFIIFSTVIGRPSKRIIFNYAPGFIRVTPTVFSNAVRRQQRRRQADGLPTERFRAKLSERYTMLPRETKQNNAPRGVHNRWRNPQNTTCSSSGGYYKNRRPIGLFEDLAVFLIVFDFFSAEYYGVRGYLSKTGPYFSGGFRVRSIATIPPWSVAL